MIVYDLECRAGGHRFEGWFGSGQDYDQQVTAGLLVCPHCGAGDIAKAVMAPNIGRKGNQLPQPAAIGRGQGADGASAPAVTNAATALPPEAAALFQAMAQAQAEALKQSRWVGERFADQARAMHYGERDHEIIHGQATADEAKALLDEGVAVAPLLFPVAPPKQVN